jgi:hypothetical protein
MIQPIGRLSHCSRQVRFGDVHLDPEHNDEIGVKIGLARGDDGDKSELVVEQGYSRMAYGTSINKIERFGKDIGAAVSAYNQAVATKKPAFGGKLRCGHEEVATEEQLRERLAEHLQRRDANRNEARYRREAAQLLPKIVEELQKGRPSAEDFLKGSGFAV